MKKLFSSFDVAKRSLKFYT